MPQPSILHIPTEPLIAQDEVATTKQVGRQA